jgi:predicted amidohydrolase
MKYRPISRSASLAALGILCLSAPGPSSELRAPEGWHTFAVRSEIAPRFWVEPAKGKPESYALGIAGEGNGAADGRWVRTVPVVGGKHYAFSAEFNPTDVSTVSRSILARILWMDGNGQQMGEAEYPFPTGKSAAKWQRLAGTYKAPPGSTAAQTELHLRWAPRGKVLWRYAVLNETSPPSARRVRLASINHRPRSSPSSEMNLDAFLTHVEEAARLKADIVCLPEGITVVGTGKKYADVAEPIPGPSTRKLGESAAKHRVYIVAGIYESDGQALYNTSVLLARDGRLAGKYRKVCLPHEEIEGGLTPGSQYPVFDTDFGKVGMMICWDSQYADPARALALRGAELILLPIWGGNTTLTRARAIENSVFIALSGYDIQTAILDPKGETVAVASGPATAVVATIDLNRRYEWEWLGDMRGRFMKEVRLDVPMRRPDYQQ